MENKDRIMDWDGERYPYDPGEAGYWQRRARDGQEYLTKPRSLSSPQMLWELACLYFERVDTTPLKKNDFIRGGERAGETVSVDAARPYTWTGFGDFLFEKGIGGRRVVENYRQNTGRKYDEYIEVISQIEQVMYTNKFDGAAVGTFAGTVMTKALGLADIVINENRNHDMGLDYSKLSASALEEIAALQKEQDEKDSTK
jgi:hypothetical protein